ncbi:hypothetical protein EMN47_12255 [Prolixibacteraceae bacterium JC049]|nr:hypothetical protein [Prolixibacteraceae bacterium JC049]
MKKRIILLLLIVSFWGPRLFAQGNKKVHEFTTDFASANVKLRGKLQLFGEYKTDLSPLMFDEYIKLLRQNETESNKGLSEMILKADKHRFMATKNTFLIAIYSKELNILVFDDANTAMLDSVVILKKNFIPDFKKFIQETGF